jgi:hypothetical protein
MMKQCFIYNRIKKIITIEVNHRPACTILEILEKFDYQIASVTSAIEAITGNHALCLRRCAAVFRVNVGPLNHF